MDVDILRGYFDLENPFQIYLDGSTFTPIFPCRECFAIILGRHINQHVEWHLDYRKPDEQKSPDDIRAEARRELGTIRHANSERNPSGLD